MRYSLNSSPVQRQASRPALLVTAPSAPPPAPKQWWNSRPPAQSVVEPLHPTLIRRTRDCSSNPGAAAEQKWTAKIRHPRYAAHFTVVGSARHTAAGVVAAPFSAVGVDVVLPVLLRLAFVLSFTLLLIGWVLLFLMRLVWTFDILRLWYLLPFLLQLLRTPHSILLLGWMLSLFFWLLVDAAPFYCCWCGR